jgi:TPP-dependent pyruvate/acetoin dehydrogenase alpha subunit
MGSYAIIGAHLPIACGAAWRAQYKREKDVSVCFFGDGTTNIGAFHEALNLAAVWKLPVVFVCENNLYMEYTPIADVTAVSSPAGDRASAYGLEKIVIDGNDADTVYRAALKALEKARAGEGTSLIECLTYRYSGHSRADPAKYRPEGELEQWKRRDPVKLYRERLKQFGVTETQIDAIERDVRKIINDVTAVCADVAIRKWRAYFSACAALPEDTYFILMRWTFGASVAVSTLSITFQPRETSQRFNLSSASHCASSSGVPRRHFMGVDASHIRCPVSLDT